MPKTKITRSMKAVPLQSTVICDDCLTMKLFLANLLADKEGNPPLAILRKECADCKKFNGKGIYKADLSVDNQLLKQKAKNRDENISQYYGKGRHPRIAIEKGLHIHKLHDEYGMSAEKISRLIGISHTTVGKILKMSIPEIKAMIAVDRERKEQKKRRRNDNLS